MSFQNICGYYGVDAELRSFIFISVMTTGQFVMNVSYAKIKYGSG
ncbi:hypothetical protein LCGC14_1619230 [marine sediment metagenome]|uniref:Uncharacterized protein n=1 Tax=marine sediment metagenome TaxID=412755 RepID=A0A0F9ISX8_9ZZZZ